jgi:hypothetical protein
MTLLRRVLALGAAALALIGVSLAVVPSVLTEGLLDQVALGDDVWLRLFGVACIALAIFHVLILRRLEDLWWWCWGFVFFDGLSAVVVVLHAAVGVPEGSAVWPWWLYGATSGLFTALYLGGLARAGQEKPLL